MAVHTVVGLKGWSCLNTRLPGVQEIKAIHIYDFDNTLFQTPLPNAQLWTTSTPGHLMSEDFFANGGWWHDQHILEATGEGIEKEEPRAWEGWWNEEVVRLVQLSMQQKDVLTVLLTGRGEINFSDIVRRMAVSKGLKFDMICLKRKQGPQGQRIKSTMHYKQSLLDDILYTYRDAEEVKIYEDRIKHVQQFRAYFDTINRAIQYQQTPVNRKQFKGEVIHVAGMMTTLNPVLEVAEVQRMINTHNTIVHQNEGSGRTVRLKLKKTVFFTGYLLSQGDSANLAQLVSLASDVPVDQWRPVATHILICERPASASILDKVGGLGAKQIWQVNGIGKHKDILVAARVTPMPSSASSYTETQTPIIVLAMRKGAYPHEANQIKNWDPVPTDKQLVFETTVGEKVQLRVEPEIFGETEFESLTERSLNLHANGNSNNNGRRGNHDDRRNNGNGHEENRRNYRGGNKNRGGGGRGGGGRDQDQRNGPYPPRGQRNGNHGGRGGGGGREGGGAGRNKGRGAYKSLDDVGNGPRGGYQDGPGGPHYDSSFPALGARSNAAAYDDGLGQMY